MRAFNVKVNLEEDARQRKDPAQEFFASPEYKWVENLHEAADLKLEQLKKSPVQP